MYQRIWLSIKEKPVGSETDVRIHKDAVARLIQAVRKEKTMDVAIRRSIGMLTEGPLSVVSKTDPKDDRFVIVTFKLRWSERLKDI